MKRDLDLIRALLLAVEALPARGESDSDAPVIELPTADQFLVAEHVRLLIEAGLVEGFMVDSFGDEPSGYSIHRLTWAGHDYLDAVRNESVWARVRQASKERGISLTFEVAKALAVQFTSAQLGLTTTA